MNYIKDICFDQVFERLNTSIPLFLTDEEFIIHLKTIFEHVRNSIEVHSFTEDIEITPIMIYDCLMSPFIKYIHKRRNFTDFGKAIPYCAIFKLIQIHYPDPVEYFKIAFRHAIIQGDNIVIIIMIGKLLDSWEPCESIIELGKELNITIDSTTLLDLVPNLISQKSGMHSIRIVSFVIIGITFSIRIFNILEIYGFNPDNIHQEEIDVYELLRKKYPLDTLVSWIMKDEPQNYDSICIFDISELLIINNRFKCIDFLIKLGHHKDIKSLFRYAFRYCESAVLEQIIKEHSDFLINNGDELTIEMWKNFKLKSYQLVYSHIKKWEINGKLVLLYKCNVEVLMKTLVNGNTENMEHFLKLGIPKPVIQTSIKQILYKTIAEIKNMEGILSLLVKYSNTPLEVYLSTLPKSILSRKGKMVILESLF